MTARGRKYKIDMNDKMTLSDGTTVFRIVALRDVREGVKAGDRGGFVESEKNLSQCGKCWISGNAIVRDSATVSENATVGGAAVVNDRAVVTGHAIVGGRAEVTDNATVSGYAIVLGGAHVHANAVVTGEAVVGGDSLVMTLQHRLRRAAEKPSTPRKNG